MTTALLAYIVCLVVSTLCALLLLRSWRQRGSRLVMWCGVAFAFLAASNAMLVADLLVAADLSLPRAVLIAVGLALLVYGVALEEAR